MPIASIRISKGSKIIHGWYIHPIPYEMTIQDFFIKLTTGELSSERNLDIIDPETIERIEISKTQDATATQVSPNCNIIEVTTNVGIYVHFRLKTDIVKSNLEPQRNYFTILMQNAHRAKLYFPTFSQLEKSNRKLNLRSDIVDWIRRHGGGWSIQSYADTQGKQFVTCLTETIWYIDMRDYKKFEDRSYHIPELFLEFFGRANPEAHKHSRKPFDANELNLHCQALAPYATSSWILKENFNWLRDALDGFIVAISDYVGFLQRQREITAINHASKTPVRTVDQATTVQIHKRNFWVAPVDRTKYYQLEQLLNDLPLWKPVDLEEFLPTDPVQRMRYVKGLSHAFSFKIGEYRFNTGNNAYNAISIWKIDEEANEEKILQENQRIISELQEDAPRYHTRAMRINYLRTCELLLPKAKPSSLQTIYRMLTGDVSAAETTDQAKLDERVRIALDLGDPEIAVDLREHNSGRPGKYDVFWGVAARFLEGKAANAVTAVDERRHDPIVHLATAISVNDLLHQIEKECPTGTPIPSAQWLRLQFWPKNPTRLSSLQFTGRLPLKFMVQTRQLRAYHQDAHYASAIFRYEKEFAVKFREITNLVFMDDKHRCKVGEPGFPVAAVERGKKVVVSKNTTFTVADHDYTKTGIIPSVTMICNIPESINGDFYAGKVHIGLKDPIFQPSSPLRHATELYNIFITEELADKPILCLYTDGGPDHRCTYTRVQLSYICLFLALDLDYFVAVRTPPQHSWKNPVERIMSILNLGLQSVGLMRTKMNDQSEKLISKVGTMNDIRKTAKENNGFKEDLIESLKTPISMIRDMFSRQSLKNEPFETFNAASEIEMEKLWETILLLDDNVPYENFTAADINQKCGESSCTICRPPRCSQEEFEQLHCLPDPIPGDDLHYKSFEEIYGTRTTENHRPSLESEVDDDTENTVSPNEEANEENMNKEDEPDQSESESTEEEEAGENVEGSGESEEESDENVESDTHGEDSINELFSRVFVNDSLSCSATIEKPYYSAGIYPAVCIECGCRDANRLAKDEHPRCSNCGGNSINPRKSSMKAK
ncbi:11116_t:CDS:2 [Ambispora leptoticha]|uniref:11116_t:CDS:1 n=1 Tax=Ambispora leptoticha TaxID=144679 RepID=A0A9N9DF82_9GLOM|nr:11116_t:CDS:2 [Ambispora leptoticha]